MRHTSACSRTASALCVLFLTAWFHSAPSRGAESTAAAALTPPWHGFREDSEAVPVDKTRASAALPPHRIERAGTSERHVWYLDLDAPDRGCHSRIYQGGAEVTGATRGTRLRCELGEFVWMGEADANTPPWLGTGWISETPWAAFSGRPHLLRQYDRLVRSEPTHRLARDGVLWIRWDNRNFPEFGRSGVHGALRVGGRWLGAEEAEEADGVIVCPAGEFVWHGEYGGDGDSGWLSAHPITRVGTATIIQGRMYELEDLRADIAMGANVKNLLGLTVHARDSSDGRLSPRYPDPEWTETIIQAGADLEAREEEGCTPLMLAVMGNANPRVAEALIRAGADVNARDVSGETALMHAARMQDDPAFVKMLIGAGADVNAASTAGRTALFGSALLRNPEILSTLLAAGADVTMVDQEGFSPALMATEHATDGFFEKAAESLKMFIRAGSRLDVRDDDGKTVMDHITASGDAELIALAESMRSGRITPSRPGPLDLYYGDLSKASDTRENRPKPLEDDGRPQFEIQKGETLWRLWIGDGWRGPYRTFLSKLFINGREVRGSRAAETLDTDLGQFMWIRDREDRVLRDHNAGWFPTDPETLARWPVHDVHVIAAELEIARTLRRPAAAPPRPSIPQDKLRRRKVALMPEAGTTTDLPIAGVERIVPSHLLARKPAYWLRDGGTLWLQWCHASGEEPPLASGLKLSVRRTGRYGALRVDGSWLGDPRNGSGPDRIATTLGEFVWTGSHGENGHGWAPAVAAPREDIVSAIRRGADAEAIAALVGHGADVNAADRDGVSALMWAAVKRDPFADDFRNRRFSHYPPAETAALLVRAGARADAADAWGHTPLMWAGAFADNPALLGDLVAAGAAVDARDDRGRTALMHAAAAAPSPDFLDPLLKAGADVNATALYRDEAYYSPTPLIEAALNNENPRIVTRLLRSGVERCQDNQLGRAFVMAEEVNGNSDVAKTLKNALDRERPCVDFSGYVPRMRTSGAPVRAMPGATDVPANPPPAHRPAPKRVATTSIPWPPSTSAARAGAEWQQWRVARSPSHQLLHGKVFVDGFESVGGVKERALECALGDFAWLRDMEEMLRGGSRRYGWAPLDREAVLEDSETHEDIGAVTRFPPDAVLRHADSRWLLWRLGGPDSPRGAFGALCLNGKWLLGGTVGERVEALGQTMVWHGPYAPDGAGAVSGWLPEGALAGPPPTAAAGMPVWLGIVDRLPPTIPAEETANP